jgi:hypothetical protein
MLPWLLLFTPVAQARRAETAPLDTRPMDDRSSRRPRISDRRSDDLALTLRQPARRMFLSPDTGARTRGDVLITGATASWEWS